MMNFVKCLIDQIEADRNVTTAEGAFRALRGLGLDDFGGFLLTIPNNDYPKLSRLLPDMASEQAQQSWTGSSGITLLKQTATFARSLAYNYNRLTGKVLDGAKILDYGCGFGRIARLMYRFTDPSNFYGVDPWDKSINLCKQARLPGNFAVSDYLPTTLPVGSTKFDLIYALSVFTHLSERALKTSMGTLRKYIAREGLLLITIRPVEIWGHIIQYTPQERETRAKEHEKKGFAFQPHQRPAVDGDITYGDASLSLDWLAKACPEWKILDWDRSFTDPYQVLVFLSPR